MECKEEYEEEELKEYTICWTYKGAHIDEVLTFDGDNADSYYCHPLTGSYCPMLHYCFQGWSDYPNGYDVQGHLSFLEWSICNRLKKEYVKNGEKRRRCWSTFSKRIFYQ